MELVRRIHDFAGYLVQRPVDTGHFPRLRVSACNLLTNAAEVLPESVSSPRFDTFRDSRLLATTARQHGRATGEGRRHPPGNKTAKRDARPRESVFGSSPIAAGCRLRADGLEH